MINLKSLRWLNSSPTNPPQTKIILSMKTGTTPKRETIYMRWSSRHSALSTKTLHAHVHVPSFKVDFRVFHRIDFKDWTIRSYLALRVLWTIIPTKIPKNSRWLRLSPCSSGLDSREPREVAKLVGTKASFGVAVYSRGQGWSLFSRIFRWAVPKRLVSWLG